MANRSPIRLRIQKPKKIAAEEMNIVVRRSNSHVAENLSNIYKDQEQVNIIIDRRYGQRRQISKPVNPDCRVADRRNHIKRDWKMNLIVKRPYAYLTDDLQQVFKGQEDINIIVDSRRQDNERRKNDKLISNDLRCGDRRRDSETLVEVVISY